MMTKHPLADVDSALVVANQALQAAILNHYHHHTYTLQRLERAINEALGLAQWLTAGGKHD